MYWRGRLAGLQPVKRKPEAQQLVQSKCAVPALQPLGPDAASVAEHEAGVSRRGIIHAGLLVGTLLSAKASKAKEAEPGVPQISSRELLEMSRRIEAMPPTYRNASSTPRLFDVRSSQEYAKYHVKNTVNVPYLPPEGFEARMMPMLEGVDKDATIVLVCATATRSKPAVKLLQEKGYKNAMELANGMEEYYKEGLPCVSCVATDWCGCCELADVNRWLEGI
eukprot:CAMPEP_0202367300 /NCGR_PEP_ID=MMETSP1126-20121109/17571_1 /ASSEMBLY_ACC=CAM_ASM_000457 /TAXON_ID=3047 /ORGANISM="Dunaliella tertiolecta, Strain CCMP1320" /LENGTH=221 /DNA_ID=CAMNT_0048962531 /DNA_START=152 /DNA_END=818 /DNA_ORIENTATION=-